MTQNFQLVKQRKNKVIFKNKHKDMDTLARTNALGKTKKKQTNPTTEKILTKKINTRK